jgi:spore coat protein U-like protein
MWDDRTGTGGRSVLGYDVPIVTLSRLAAALLVAGLAPAAEAACTISATGPSFGVYSPFAPAPLDAAGSVTISCTSPALVGMGPGMSGNSQNREMRSASNRLRYNLYVDAARTTIWGEPGGPNDVDIPAGQNLRVPIFGRVFSLQDVVPGTYADTVMLIVHF